MGLDRRIHRMPGTHRPYFLAHVLHEAKKHRCDVRRDEVQQGVQKRRQHVTYNNTHLDPFDSGHCEHMHQSLKGRSESVGAR